MQLVDISPVQIAKPNSDIAVSHDPRYNDVFVLLQNPDNTINWTSAYISDESPLNNPAAGLGRPGTRLTSSWAQINGSSEGPIHLWQNADNSTIQACMFNTDNGLIFNATLALPP